MLFYFRTTGDGNCLFNACSLLLKRDEHIAVHLRLLTAIELFQHCHKYAEHEIFRRAADEGGFLHFDTAFKASVTNTVLESDIANSSNVDLVEKTALEILNFSNYKFTFVPFLCVIALADVLKSSIKVLCNNDVDQRLRFLYNCSIQPDIVENKDIFLFWHSTSSDLSKLDHFVPLVDEKLILKSSLQPRKSFLGSLVNRVPRRKIKVLHSSSSLPNNVHQKNWKVIRCKMKLVIVGRV